MQITKCLYQDVDHYVTSVLIELFNNEPNLAKGSPIMRELLNHIINREQICSKNVQFTRKGQNRRYSHKKKDIIKESDCTVLQILDRTRFPKFLSHLPFALCRSLRTTPGGTTTDTSEKNVDVSGGPKDWVEALTTFRKKRSIKTV